jgi:tyrosine-protein kinase Etk/Wzc
VNKPRNENDNQESVAEPDMPKSNQEQEIIGLRREMQQLVKRLGLMTKEEVIGLREDMQKLKQERDPLQSALAMSFSPPPSISLGEFLATFFESRWLISAIAFFITMIGALYLLVAEPIYRVDALLETGMHIDLLADISKGFKEETVVTEEMEVLKSRKVLGEVVDDQKLDIVTQPVYFPIIGSSIAQVNTKLKSLSHPISLGIPFINVTGYAWSNERIKVENFDIPTEYLGKIFTVKVKENKEYQIVDEDGEQVGEGKVGVSSTIKFPDGKPHELLVSRIKAKPGTRFELSKISRIDAINQLSELIMVSEKGLGSGVVQISLEGADTNKISAIINKLVNTFVQQERETKSDKIGLSLEFMEKQTPILKEQVEKAEEAINVYRQHHGAVDLSKETQIILERMVSIEAELSESRRKYAELRYKFTPEHSQMMALSNQMGALNKELDTLNRKVNTFPETEREMLRLTKDAELYSELYGFLRNRIGQLRVVQDAPVGYVGVLDLAVPSDEPVKPNIAAVMGVALALGIFLGIGAAFMRKALRNAVKDPEVIEKQLGLPVYATVPHSAKQRKLLKAVEGDQNVLLAVAEPTDPAIEGLRSLRTSFHFMLLEAKNNVILITGPVPDIGKSFITVNLGAVLASTGKRVLLIDADLRKGHLNKHFGLDSKDGLSDAIANGEPIEQVIRKTNIDGLDIICTGTPPPNPSELLSHDRFVAAIEKLSLQYDYVMIDSPPVLLVTDPAIIGRLAGTTLLVVKAGAHTIREIEHSIKRLEQGGVNLRGVVFNDMPVSKSRYGYGDYYGYAYEYSNKK